MTDPTPPTPQRQPLSRAERQHVIDALCDAYAADQIDMSELERRLDLANQAGTGGELARLLDGIRAAPPPVPLARGPGGGSRPGNPGSAVTPDNRSSAAVGWGRVEPERVRDRQFHLAVWSGRARRGGWIPARHITAFAFMGGVELDFREALFGSRVIEVTAMAVMGGVEIIVPPGVHVETSGFALMGGFEDQVSGPAGTDASAPTIRVNGFALMGGVEITVRHPGESSKQAARRLKEEHRRALEP
jgi:hypothetical protein